MIESALHETGFSSFLSMFDHNIPFHFAPNIREPRHDVRMRDVMLEVEVCQRADPPTGDSQPVCPGVARECRMDKDYRGGKVGAARLTASAGSR
jgi:hypothetical protein